ncbi:MAG: hypothetical protein AAF557_03775 [Pseudomonadota bacterium]
MRLMLAALLVAFSAVHSYAFESRVLSFEYDGIDRGALIDAQTGLRGAPMLVVLHGGIAGPYWVRRQAQVTLASQGWVVAWPEAVDDWNDGRTNSRGRPYDDADDVGFLRRMIEILAEQGVVDPARVFFAGPSIGGVMTLRMLCEAPDLVAGAAVAIASFAESYSCPEGPPRPVLYIHGTDDGIMDPEGGRIGGWNPLIRDRGRVEPVERTMAKLAQRNGCTGLQEEALPDVYEPDGSTVRRRIYQGCAEPLVHFIVDGGGHTWPGSRRSPAATFVGETNQDFSATQTVQAFFQAIAAQRTAQGNSP